MQDSSRKDRGDGISSVEARVMSRTGPEHRFEDRLRRRFEWAGYVVIKCAASRPFDLIVMKGGYVAALELKALGADVDPEQRERQYRLAQDAGIDLLVLRQEEGGKVSVFCENTADGDQYKASKLLYEVLGKYLVAGLRDAERGPERVP